MTREEAIKNLVAYEYFVYGIPEKVAESLDMAIEALKEEKIRPVYFNDDSPIGGFHDD